MQSGVTLDPPFNGIATADIVDAEQLETLQMRSSGLQLKRADIARTATALYMGFEWARCRLSAKRLCLTCISAEMQLGWRMGGCAARHVLTVLSMDL